MQLVCLEVFQDVFLFVFVHSVGRANSAMYKSSLIVARSGDVLTAKGTNL